jgi:hypothetical protein
VIVLRHLASLVVAACALTGAAGQLVAQPACPPGNLLAGRKPWAWQDIQGDLARATDGQVAPEGALWNAPLATVLATGAATLTWDLQQVVTVTAAWIQADANDSYTVWGSTDGRDYRVLGRIEPVRGDGLRGRKLALGGTPVRFLRFGEGSGDDFYSVSEITVFCELPTPFPPVMPVGAAPPASVAATVFTYWNDETSARWELVLAVLGLALLEWGRRLSREGRPGAHVRLRDALLAVLGGLAALSYVNFGFFHFGAFIHEHEWTHYYLGAKYSRELSYDGLYECLSVADVDAGLRRRVELRKIRNLHTNALETTATILAHPERCTARFSEARWQAFQRDAAFFRARQNPQRWDRIQVDHGYNATPVWNALGSALTNLAPASSTQLYALALLDPLYLVALIAVIWWAFGWRVLSVALVVFATNFPSRFYWTGGAFMRWDWLFYLVAGLCCLRKGRPILAGAALCCAASLRVFPVFVFVGPLFALGWRVWETRRWERRWLRLFAGAVGAGVLLVLASLPFTGGTAGYRRFVENTRKHEGTYMTNNMGLPTVLAWRPGGVGRLLNDDHLIEPWSKVKEARQAALRQARPLHVIITLGYLILLALAVRRAEPWVAAALSLGLISVGVELTSYYYAFVIGVALLCQEREEVGRWLLVLTTFTGIIAWAPLRGMSTWFDEQYTAMAAGTVAVMVAIAWLFSRGGPDPHRGSSSS